MGHNYLDIIYFRDEYGEDQYPQKLCNYIAERFFGDAPARKGREILDVGSGKGNHLVGFKRNGLKPYGIDKRDECLKIFDEFDIRPCNLEKDPLPFEDETFDFVFSKSVLEHVTNTDNFLKESLRVLKPGGKAVMLTPDWGSQCKFFWDDYTHVKAFTRKSLQNAMAICGFENPQCEYFLQLPFTWKYPWAEFFTSIIALLPDRLKWKDKDESEFRILIRFSKEKMLLSYGTKP